MKRKVTVKSTKENMYNNNEFNNGYAIFYFCLYRYVMPFSWCVVAVTLPIVSVHIQCQASI